MKLYKYKNYQEYIKCQKEANKKKFNNIWAVEQNIRAISKVIQTHFYNICPSIGGLCHGVRQGHEVFWFKKYLGDNAYVIGTDIGKPAAGRVKQHDFNKQNEFWIKCFNFIYSNSFDHAYDPEKTFSVWVDQVKPGGLVILEYDRRQEHTGEISRGVNKIDPVSITFEELQALVKKWNKRVKKIFVIDMPVVTQQWRKALFIEV